MKLFLRILFVFFCMLVLTPLQAIPPTLNQITLYNQSAVALTAPTHPTGSFINIPTNTTVILTFDQAVFQIGGAAFTANEDITSFFTLNDGAAVPFTATINGLIVTITPTSELKSSTIHTITLLAGFVQENTPLSNTLQTVDFTTATTITPTAPASLNLCRNGVAKVLGDIVITEGSSASFGGGLAQTFEMNAPAGFNFVAGLGSVTETGADISNATLLVTATKITLTYDIGTGYGAILDAITIQNIQVVWVSGTANANLIRTASTATQAGNNVSDAKTHATFTSSALPTAPTPTNYLLVSGFGLATNLSPAFTVPAGSIGRFYAADGTTIRYTSGVAPVSNLINVTPTNLGYVSNAALGTTQFYMTIITGTCESAQAGFTITVGVATPPKPTITDIQTYNIGGTPPVSITNTPTNTQLSITFNAAIFNASGGTVNNAYATSSVFTLVDNLLAAVPFTATISGNIITITPNSELKESTTYTLTFVVGSLSSSATVSAATLNNTSALPFTTASSVIIPAPTTLSAPPTSLAICNNNTHKLLGNIVISEASSAGFGQGANQSFEMDAPTGFEFKAGAGSVSVVGADISGASISVVLNRITVFYTVNSNYASTDVITLSGIEVKVTSATGSLNLVRTGGTATQSANRVDNVKSHATFSAVLSPATAPTLVAQANLSGVVYDVCQGFTGQTVSVANSGFGAGSIIKVYNKATNILLFTSAPIATAVINVATDLLVSNAILGTQTFYARRVSSAASGSCDGPTIDFSVVVNPNPFAIIVGGSASFCSGATPTFSAFGTAGNTYVFTIKPSASAFVAASGYGIVTANNFTPSASIATDSYILQASATNTNGCSVITTMPFVVNAATTPTFAFGITSYPDNQTTAVALSGGLPAGGTYSGPGVVGTDFFPNAAGIGTHAIVYSYTNASLCVGTATVFFTVFNASVPITGLANSYCNNSPITGIITPNVAIFPSVTNAIAPTNISPVGLSFGVLQEFFFPLPPFIAPNVNEGIVWDGTNYRFDPSLVNISSGAFKVVPIIFVRYSNGGFQADPNVISYNVTVYAIPALAVNFLPSTPFQVSPTKIFCKSDSPVIVGAVVNGAVAPSGAIISFQYKLNSSPTWLTLPGNTITPSALAVGDYDFRMLYTSPAGLGGCVAPDVVRSFRIINSVTPTFTLGNLDYCVSTVANPTSIAVNAIDSGFSRFFTITQTSPVLGVPLVIPIADGSPAAINLSVPVVNLNGIGTYSVTFTSTNGTCAGTSAPQSFTISTLPVLTVDFTYVSPTNGNTPAAPNKFCVGNNTLTFAVSATNLGIETFDPSRGFITIRNNSSSSPSTSAFSQNLAGGINSLSIFYVTFLQQGEYFIDYTYTKLNGCVVKTTSSSLLIYSFYPAPDYNFPIATAPNGNYGICESVTSLTLTPSFLSGVGLYGTDLAIDPTRGIYTFTKGPFSTTISGTNTFNPRTMLVLAPGGGVGTYALKYAYTSASGCTGESFTRNLVINALPAVNFDFALDIFGAPDNKFCANRNSAQLIITPGTIAGGFNGLNGYFTINKQGNSTILSTLLPVAGTFVNFNPSLLIASAGFGVYEVRYRYTDANTCETITAPKTFEIYPLPVVSFNFPNGLNTYSVCDGTASIILSLNTSITSGIGTINVKKQGTFGAGIDFSGTNTIIPSAFSGTAGTDEGTYDISYSFTTTDGCTGYSIIKVLTITPKPDLGITLSTFSVCAFASLTITAIPSWNNGSPLLATSGRVRIYDNFGTLVLSLPSGINAINMSNPVFAAALVSPTATTFQVGYEYTDTKGCFNQTLFRVLFVVQPLPVVSFSFAGGDNKFCADEAVATLNISSGVIAGGFDGNNGFFEINKLGSPIVLTTINGVTGTVNTFSPFLIAITPGGGAGTYQIRYKYNDINVPSCQATTPPQTFNIYSLPQPNFDFPTVGATTYAVCANTTSLNISASLLNASDVTVGIFNSANGFFTFSKAPFSVNVAASGAITNINPSTLLVAAAGGGVGIYNVTYTYTTSTNACVSVSLSKSLVVNPLPVLVFSITPGVSICESTTNIILTPTVNALPPTPLSGFFTINQVTPTNTFVRTSISPVVDHTIALSLLNGIGTYNISYTYTDTNGCTNVSVPTLITIRALPIITISLPASVPVVAGNANFCRNAPTIDFVPPVIIGGGFNANMGYYTVTKGTYTQVINPTSATNPISSLNPSALYATPFAGAGLYSVVYTYTNIFGCTNTSNLLGFNINELPDPVFNFPTVGTQNFSICYNPLGTVTLVPNLLNPTTDFGISSFTPAQGQFTITKIPTLANPITSVITLGAGVSNISLGTLFAAAGTGDYDISYTYTSNPQGCTVTIPAAPLTLPLPASNTRRILTINPIPTVDFTFAAGTGVIKDPIPLTAATTTITVCANFTEVDLLPTSSLSPFNVSLLNYFKVEDITIPTTPVLLPNITSVPFKATPAALVIFPLGTTVRTFRLTFYYIDINGCTSVSAPRIIVVVPLPIPTFATPLQTCEGVPVTLTATGTIAAHPGTLYTWDFGDGTGTSQPTVTTSPTIVHTFPAAGTFFVNTTINTQLTCEATGTKSINIGAIPTASFTTASFCQGNVTSFASTSTILGSTFISNYAWDFGDGIVSLINAAGNITHIYASSGKYVAKLTVTTNFSCSSFVEKNVFVFPKITPTAAAPYKDNFDAPLDDNSWLPTGLIKSTLNPLQDTTGYSWKRGVPTGAKINAATATGGVWSTTSGRANSVGGLDSTFYPSERSYVESPCFNFTDLTLNKPVIAMKIWYDTDRGADGAVLYASINDGVSWNVVGTINEGLEWYNTAGIIAQPGGQAVVNAWTGDTLTKFKLAKFNLDQFRGQASVRFRVGFGSNADNPIGRTFDGFAFDEVFIGNRNRISLLEHFTNASSSEANTENTFINNFPSVTIQNEIYNIQYHTNIPGSDPMNADNTADPSARALYYGVSQVPRTAIDGAIENRKFSEWGTPVYNRRTLETSPFELSVDFSSTTQLLRFKATVKALEPFSRRVILQTVVIEQEILGTALVGGNFGGLTFKNVVKKMIPNAAGTLIAQTWLQNTQFQTGELVWSPSKVYNGNKLVLVVFVQDEVTKEIYQAGFFNITTNPTGTDPTTALDPQTQAQTLDDEFVVYPNPAQNSVFTGFRNETSEDFKVVIFDSYGKRVDDYALPKGNKGLLLNTEKYASGMYFVEITGKNNIKARRKLVVVR